MTYADYLNLDSLLDAQHPLTEEHDELLFIIIHQTSELWMKLTLHELQGAAQSISTDQLAPALKMLSRVGRIQTQMTQAWEILATMTPADYQRFRYALGQSSGFQSLQYRLIEFLFGAKNRSTATSYHSNPTASSAILSALTAPSLYDRTLNLMSRRGLPIPTEKLDRDFADPYVASKEVEAAWLVVYRDIGRWWDLYELGEKLVDLEYRMQQWRFAHLKTVERVIGFKVGTGGSAGVSYLARVMEQGFFPELLSMRTVL